MLLLFARERVDVHTNALCYYRQTHHQCVDDTWEYTLKWELEIVLPSFLLCLTLQDNSGKAERFNSMAGQRAQQWPFLNEGKLNENTFLTGTDFLNIFLGVPFVEHFLGYTRDGRWQVSLLLIAILLALIYMVSYNGLPLTFYTTGPEFFIIFSLYYCNLGGSNVFFFCFSNQNPHFNI